MKLFMTQVEDEKENKKVTFQEGGADDSQTEQQRGMTAPAHNANSHTGGRLTK